METKEINSTAWEEFCNKLQGIRPRARLTIERVDRNGRPAPVISNLELREARLNRAGACNDIISFTLAKDNDEEVEYTIIEPIHIKLRPEDGDRYNAIEIIAENGKHVLTARPGFRRDLIEDLA